MNSLLFTIVGVVGAALLAGVVWLFNAYLSAKKQLVEVETRNTLVEAENELLRDQVEMLTNSGGTDAVDELQSGNF